MRCLLDKGTARRMLEGLLNLAQGRELTPAELSAVDLFAQADGRMLRLFIVPPTANVLRKLARLPRYTGIVELFIARVEIAQPTRYFKRWARRLRDHGFTREDAAVLALGTFGTDDSGSILGMHALVTHDQAMLNHWSVQQPVIRASLAAMQRDIPEPYCLTRLPQALHPDGISLPTGGERE